jgi:hypothetical protein
VPHAPQLALSVCVLVQVVDVPQRVVPVAHAARQLPATQVVPVPHARPHVPQLALSVCVLVHVVEVPQRVVPVAHAARQLPAMQLVPVPHSRPHVPQLALSVCALTQAVPQPVRPPVQVGVPVQAPAVHACPARHARPQPPQWAVLVCVLTQVMPQPVRPPVQMSEHVLVAQVRPVAHAPPQRPQLAPSVRRSTSQPLAALRSQSPKPALQVYPHAPAAHVAVALARVGHTLPQVPQFVGLVAVAASQPLAALRSQSVKPGLQAPAPQTPAVHVAVALAGTGQALPQVPQLERLVAVTAQALPQQVWPLGHALVGEHPETQEPRRHTWPAPQCESSTHCEQLLRAVSQRGRAVLGQSASVPQPYEHMFAAALQYCPAPQSVL